MSDLSIATEIAFNNGFRCSEAILKIYGKKLGLNEDLAMKLGCALGGGLGSTGYACGAVTAATLILGLVFGRTSPTDNSQKDVTDKMIKKFIDQFINTHKYINCCDLLRNNKSDCNQYVKDACKILDEII